MKISALRVQSVPGLELGSAPLELVVVVPKTHVPREQGVELAVGGTDDHGPRSHVTEDHVGEALHIGEREVLDAAERPRGKTTAIRYVTEKQKDE